MSLRGAVSFALEYLPTKSLEYFSVEKAIGHTTVTHGRFVHPASSANIAVVWRAAFKLY